MVHAPAAPAEALSPRTTIAADSRATGTTTAQTDEPPILRGAVSDASTTAAGGHTPRRPDTIDAASALREGMIPSMLAALAQFKRGGPTFFAGKATDGFRQLFDLYCSPGGINCLGEQTSHAAPNALTPPFHDFGYVRWPRAALREGARTVCPTMDASDAPALVFVHPFASLVLALERTPPEPEEEEEEQEEEEAGGRSTLFARRFGDLWGGNWIFPPYVALRDAGHRVHLSSHVVPGQINVLMAYGGGYLGAPDELANMCAAAVIACADTAAAPALLAAGCHVIVQNALQPTATATNGF